MAGDRESTMRISLEADVSAVLTSPSVSPPPPPPAPVHSIPLGTLTKRQSGVRPETEDDDHRQVLGSIRRLVEFCLPKRNPALLPDRSDGDVLSGWYCSLSLLHTSAVIQEGPSCGFAALCVSAQVLAPRTDLGTDALSPQGPQNLIDWAKYQGYTHCGELFSVDNVAAILSEHFVCAPAVLPFSDNETILRRLDADQIFLVPYDHGPNHEPINKNGHGAHWCIVLGYVKLTNERYNFEEIHVLARHGSSRRVSLWSLEELRVSNGNLHQFDPKRRRLGSHWKVDDFDDLSGLRGLCVAVPVPSGMKGKRRWRVDGSLKDLVSNSLR
ncbi:hypothetical protein RvY_17123 [Ramazzottius varieornatus]|uniref:Actin maturation protease n=1 Tax=Ramazzottius varieornatus TaxID=947166 RepID=A0A1D1W742_RAMVA|nr:hypothetical protein RvY_17123 [Ramazzottius varieornatus]